VDLLHLRAATPVYRLPSSLKIMRVSIPGRGVLEGGEIVDPASQEPKCHRFSGIPYAVPPIGHRRWLKPAPLPSDFSYGLESDPGEFTNPSRACPQLARFGVQEAAEDCLQLNIWIPLDPVPRGGWPVYFYIRRSRLY
jgi:carboxylesterase type B